MTKNSRKPSALELRQRAEVRLAQQAPYVFPAEADAQRKLHELQLQQIELEMQTRSHDQLEALTSAIPGVVYQFLITPSGECKFTYLSNGVEDIFGVTAAKALLDYSALVTFILPEDRASQREAVERSKANLSLYDHDHRIRTAGGRLKWVRGRAMPQRLANGTVLWNGILSDITEEKLAEKKLQELAHELEQQVKVRTTSLRVLAAQLTMTEEREQRMLAQELHDNLSQLLAVAKAS